MKTTTKTRKTTKQQPRSAKLLILSNGYKVLCLTIGDELQSYGLTPIPSDFGTAYHLLKADKGDGPGEEYDVLLNGPQSSCTCKGNNYHGHCKHVEALTALVKCGALAVPSVASKPEPSKVCFECGRPSEGFYCDNGLCGSI
jgi:hypothetical protein